MLRKLAVLFPGTTSVLSATGGLAGFENGFLNIFEIFGAAAEIFQNLFGFLKVSSFVRSFVRSFRRSFVRSVVSTLTCRFTFIYRFFGPLKGLPLNTLENYTSRAASTHRVPGWRSGRYRTRRSFFGGSVKIIRAGHVKIQ